MQHRQAFGFAAAAQSSRSAHCGPQDVTSHRHRGELLVAGDAGAAGGGRAGGLKRSVAPLRGVQEGLGGGHRVGVADVLRVQELSLVGHDLRGLLAVEH